MIKPIPNFDGYFCDESGRIYSNKGIGRYAKTQNTIHPIKLIKTRFNGKFYYVVGLRRNGSTFQKLVHRLVLKTFVGECPIGMVCCHGVNGTLDNSLENICWGTWFKNHNEDKKRDGTLLLGERHQNSRLKLSQVKEIKRLAGVLKPKMISDRTGVSMTNIYHILNHQTWSWVK